MVFFSATVSLHFKLSWPLLLLYRSTVAMNCTDWNHSAKLTGFEKAGLPGWSMSSRESLTPPGTETRNLPRNFLALRMKLVCYIRLAVTTEITPRINGPCNMAHKVEVVLKCSTSWLNRAETGFTVNWALNYCTGGTIILTNSLALMINTLRIHLPPVLVRMQKLPAIWTPHYHNPCRRNYVGTDDGVQKLGLLRLTGLAPVSALGIAMHRLPSFATVIYLIMPTWPVSMTNS